MPGTNERFAKLAKKILEEQFWIPEIETGFLYQRLHDDHDGEFSGMVEVFFLDNADGVLTTDCHRGPALRFRNEVGGGRSLRVRNALMLLALAIKLDNEQRPDPTNGSESQADNRAKLVGKLKKNFIEDLKRIAVMEHADGCVSGLVPNSCTCGVRDAQEFLKKLAE